MTTWTRSELTDSFWHLISDWMKRFSRVWESRLAIATGWRNFRMGFESCDRFYLKISVRQYEIISNGLGKRLVDVNCLLSRTIVGFVSKKTFPVSCTHWFIHRFFNWSYLLRASKRMLATILLLCRRVQ